MTKKTALAKKKEKKKKSKHKEAWEGILFILFAVLLFSVPKIVAYHPNSLAGHFLVARIGNDGGAPLAKTVIFLTEHDKTKAIGYVINKPLEPVTAQELYDQLDIRPSGRFTSIFTTTAWAETFLNDILQIQLQPYWGGSREAEEDNTRLLFTGNYSRRNTDKIADTNAKISTNMQALNTIIERGDKATPYKIIIGYSGWNAGQLDREISKGYWWVLPYDYDILFTRPADTLWDNLFTELSKNDDDTKQPAE